MAHNVCSWLKSLKPQNSYDLDKLTIFDCAYHMVEIHALLKRNLHHYNRIFAPLDTNPDCKYQLYYFYITVVLYVGKYTGGNVVDEEHVYIQTMLVSFVDIIVDNPEFGMKTAYGIGLYIFKDIPFQVPYALKHDTEHVKRIVNASHRKTEIFEYMLALGEIEKQICRCKDLETYAQLRLRSNCLLLWNSCEWVHDSLAYALSSIGIILDDILDMSTDTIVYINNDNLDYYVEKVMNCIQLVGFHMRCNINPYYKIIEIVLKSVAKYSIINKDYAVKAIKGFKLWCLSIVVLIAIRVQDTGLQMFIL